MTTEKEATLKQYQKDSDTKDFIQLMREDADRDEIVINEFADDDRKYNPEEEYDWIW
jgi:hypothetical protein